jgi:hypothetical protein
MSEEFWGNKHGSDVIASISAVAEIGPRMGSDNQPELLIELLRIDGLEA